MIHHKKTQKPAYLFVENPHEQMVKLNRDR